MKFRPYVTVALMVALLPAAALAGACDDLARLARKTGGAWTELKDLPARSVAEDGPWPSLEARDEGKPSGFVPRDPSDRKRVLAEAPNDAVAAAYLAPSAKAFDAQLEILQDNNDSPAIILRVHRWPGTNVFAVSAHDSVWYDCQREIALFYTDKAGRLHYGGAGGTDCVGRGDVERDFVPVTIGGRLAFLDDAPVLTSVTSEVSLRQSIAFWQGDHVGPACRLAYTSAIDYSLADLSEQSDRDEKGRRKAATALDAYLERSFPTLMREYAAQKLAAIRKGAADKQEKAYYEDMMARFKAFSGEDTTRFAGLKSAYDKLRKDYVPFEAAMPVEQNGTAYLLTFEQQMTIGIYPYIDLVLYSADGQPPRRRATLVVERKVGKLMSVKVETDRR